jgi:hypothetical protein
MTAAPSGEVQSVRPSCVVHAKATPVRRSALLNQTCTSWPGDGTSENETEEMSVPVTA